MQKKRRVLASLVGLLLLAGLCGAIYFGAVKSNWGHKLLTRRVDGQESSARNEPSRGVTGLANPSRATPPRLALDNEAAAEAQRSSETVQQLAKAAKLTPEQQVRAASIIRDIEHMHSLAARFSNAEQRRSLHEKLDKQERLSMDAVIKAEQAADVDAYFAKRTRAWE